MKKFFIMKATTSSNGLVDSDSTFSGDKLHENLESVSSKLYLEVAAFMIKKN